MKDVVNYSLFLEGKIDGMIQLPSYKQSLFKHLSVFYRLGLLYGSTRNRPRLMQLIIELYREFSFSNSALPNLANICLHDTYSHRLLKTTFKKIGYQIPAKPNCSGFHAWRVK